MDSDKLYLKNVNEQEKRSWNLFNSCYVVITLQKESEKGYALQSLQKAKRTSGWQRAVFCNWHLQGWRQLAPQVIGGHGMLHLGPKRPGLHSQKPKTLLQRIEGHIMGQRRSHFSP